MITPGACITAARKVGFTGNDLVIAVAIAMAGSGLNETYSERQPDGSIVYGLWRISSKETSLTVALSSGAWKDPTVNAGLANDVFRRKGWDGFPGVRPANTWLHVRFLTAYPVAAAAVGAQTAGAPVEKKIDEITGNVPDPLAATKSALGEGVAALRWLQDPQTWVRVSKIALGGALVLGSILILVQGAGAKVAAPVVGAVVGGKVKAAKSVMKGSSS